MRVNQQQSTQIVSFIWRIADDVLRDVFVRGKYRDVILPMTVIRRLDAVLEPTKAAVIDELERATKLGIPDPDALLKAASSNPFYNTSTFTLKTLLNSPRQLQANFTDYLDGFSPNVREILEQFEFRNQIPKLAKEDRIGLLLQRFTDPDINLSPRPTATRPGLDNHAMGTIFEELIRRFNEENNEEAGEHFTPRDVVKLMADLVLRPVADSIESGTYSIYDGACGTGGMLTVAEERLRQIADAHGKSIDVLLYGQEVNGETWAISRADQLIKGEDADHIAHGSTLAADAFPSRKFDFMLSNPPYGKSWKADLDRLGGKGNMHDARFVIDFAGNPEYSLVTRSSDGQMMFLADKLAKMMDSEDGSRIAEVHNGSSLFTGDAGQGESNIRRWIIESDWLEAIIALPNNMFYNTGIATYIWVVSNRKADYRQGKVQLIDATKRFTPLRKNLGQKNAVLGDDDIQAIWADFDAFDETDTSKIFDNRAFGYWKVTVDRPLRLRVDIPRDAANVGGAPDQTRVGADPANAGRPPGRPRGDIVPTDAYLALSQTVRDTLQTVAADTGTRSFDDYAAFETALARAAKRTGLKLTAVVKKQIRAAIASRDENAEPIVSRASRLQYAAGNEGDAAHGRVVIQIEGRPHLVEYEPDPDLRDTDQIPLTDPDGIEGFIAREVMPYARDAWVVEGSERIGYEISFTRYFYKPQKLRTLAEIEADIRALEAETEGLLEDILASTALR